MLGGARYVNVMRRVQYEPGTLEIKVLFFIYHSNWPIRNDQKSRF